MLFQKAERPSSPTLQRVTSLVTQSLSEYFMLVCVSGDFNPPLSVSRLLL